MDVGREHFIHHEGLDVEGEPPRVAGHFFKCQVLIVRLAGMNAAVENLAHPAGILHMVKVLMGNQQVRDDDIGFFGVNPIRESGGSVHRHVSVILCLEKITITGSYSARINTNPIHGEGL